MIAVGDAGAPHFGHRPQQPLFAFVWLISITSIMECVWFLRKSGVIDYESKNKKTLKKGSKRFINKKSDY